MEIHLHQETALTLRRMHEPVLEVVADSEALHYGAMQMFVSSLALCTFAVLASYAERIQAGVEDLEMRMEWRYEERPRRIGYIEMRIRWPQLPESRLDAAARAAAMCTLHNTLHHTVDIDTVVNP